MKADLLLGDARDVLAAVPARSARCCVTSPPYYGLRDYGADGQIGLEETPAQYVDQLVDVFREVRRVLTDDGTLWVNLGDSYAANGAVNRGPQTSLQMVDGQPVRVRAANDSDSRANLTARLTSGVRPKNLLGIPWRVAFALQDDGWYLRSDIIWAKPNPMPESVTDRPTKAHEYIFLLAKSERYYYDAAAIREPRVTNRDAGVAGWATGPGDHSAIGHNRAAGGPVKFLRSHATDRGHVDIDEAERNRRSVWTVTSQPYPDAHFATYPPELVRPCILAGSAPRDTVLDPFNGSGTTGLVALQHDRDYIGVDVNAEYLELSRRRLAPLLQQPRLLPVTS